MFIQVLQLRPSAPPHTLYLQVYARAPGHHNNILLPHTQLKFVVGNATKCNR